MRDYMIEYEDCSLPETVEKTKAKAIATAKREAKEYNSTATVYPCIDGCVNDFAPYYTVTPDGKVTEERD